MDLLNELNRITQLHAYATTGDERFLKDMPPMGFNDPVHLPQPLAREPRMEFDIYDDALMGDLCGKLAKPIQDLLMAHEAGHGGTLSAELKALRDAVKREFDDL